MTQPAHYPHTKQCVNKLNKTVHMFKHDKRHVINRNAIIGNSLSKNDVKVMGNDLVTSSEDCKIEYTHDVIKKAITWPTNKDKKYVVTHGSSLNDEIVNKIDCENVVDEDTSMVQQKLSDLPIILNDPYSTDIAMDMPSQPLIAEFFETWTTFENLFSAMSDVMLAHKVIEYGCPNRFGARIPLTTNWNIPLMSSLLADYEDREILEWLTYGFPISYDPFAGDPTPNTVNHRGAEKFPSVIDDYVTRELKFRSTFGPFGIPPFMNRIGISPFSTREKRDSPDRRIIMDLSFPIHGKSVNQGISADHYLGQPIELRYPTIDTLAARIAELGPGCKLFKLDLCKYFRQIPVCPFDYSLLGWRWRGLLFFDRCMPMGLRSAAYVAQRISNCIAHMHHQAGYFSINYLDDFGSAEIESKAWDSYTMLRKLLHEIGVKEAEHKSVEPCTRLTFLGVTFDTIKMTMEVSDDRLIELREELSKWKHRSLFTRKNLESLIGKLQFVTNCVRGSRVFLARLIQRLTGLQNGQLTPVDEDISKDIDWWHRFLPTFNGVGILWYTQITIPDEMLATDSCLVGAGGICQDEYFAVKYSKEQLEATTNIAQREMMAIIIALKCWYRKLHSKSFKIRCDNLAVCQCLNKGIAKDKFLLKGLREVAWLSAKYSFQIKTVHIFGSINVIPDLSQECT